MERKGEEGEGKALCEYDKEGWDELWALFSVIQGWLAAAALKAFIPCLWESGGRRLHSQLHCTCRF